MFYGFNGTSPVGNRLSNIPKGSSIPELACPNIPDRAEASSLIQPAPGRLANISSPVIIISIRMPAASESYSITSRIRPFAVFAISKDKDRSCPCVFISMSTCARKLCNALVN